MTCADKAKAKQSRDRQRHGVAGKRRARQRHGRELTCMAMEKPGIELLWHSTAGQCDATLRPQSNSIDELGIALLRQRTHGAEIHSNSRAGISSAVA